MANSLVGAIDQGTTSSRFIVFDSKGQVVCKSQKPIKIITPKPGWVEQDPKEMVSNVLDCIADCCDQLLFLKYNPTKLIKGIGITNQRETTILWNKHTGEPYYNAIVWSDTRTSSIAEEYTKKYGKDGFVKLTGLPISSYFSALKIRWLLDRVPKLSQEIAAGNCLFGTVDSWLIWKLTKVHVTDVTNASRTLLMNLRTLKWEESLCKAFDVPMSILPEIRSSSEIYGEISEGHLKGVPISGCLGDQQASLFGQRCFRLGNVKNTYGTGCFILLNTGQTPVLSSNGLLTTVAYKLSPEQPPIYALEGSVAVAGSLIDWLSNKLKLFESVKDFDKLASSIKETGGVYFVPAFSGLMAPYWKENARGVIIGITQYTTNEHICLAALESIPFQTEEILDAMRKDVDFEIERMMIDGGLANSPLLGQLQSDISGIKVVSSQLKESTALGAAFVAGLSTKVYSIKAIEELEFKEKEFEPKIEKGPRLRRLENWRKAVHKSLDPPEAYSPDSNSSHSRL